MATVRDVALPLAGICTSVPPAGEGVCARCHGCPGTGFPICWSCNTVERQVSRPCETVVPISLYDIPSQLHWVLRHYKSGHYPDAEDRFRLQVAALIGHFLKEHGRCLAVTAGGFWEVVTTVPSSRPTSGEHPLATAIQMVLQLGERYELLLARGAGPLDHNVASDRAFELRRRLEGERVLLLDDTFTTGARAQSAASTINNGGGNVMAIVTVGRVIDPHFGPHVEEYWKRQRRRPFDFATCCLE